MAGQDSPAPCRASPRGYGCWPSPGLEHSKGCGVKRSFLASLRPRTAADSPARVRNQTLRQQRLCIVNPTAGRQAQVAAMLMPLPRQNPAVCRSCRPRGQSPSSTFSLFFPVQAKSNEVNFSLAPPAEAGTQVNTLQHRPVAGATFQHLPCPSGWSKIQRQGLQEIMHICPKPNEKSCNLLCFPLSQSSLAGNPASTSAGTSASSSAGVSWQQLSALEDEKPHKFWWQQGHAQRRCTFGVTVPAAPMNK